MYIRASRYVHMYVDANGRLEFTGQATVVGTHTEKPFVRITYIGTCKT